MYNSYFGFFFSTRRIPIGSMRAYIRLIFTLAAIADLGHLSPAAGADSSSTRSGPPDTTPYTRPAVPEDTAPFGQPARPQTPDCDQDVNQGEKKNPRSSSASKKRPCPDATAPKKSTSDDPKKTK